MLTTWWILLSREGHSLKTSLRTTEPYQETTWGENKGVHALYAPWSLPATQFLNHWYRQSVQLLSCVQCFATLWTAARQASLYITDSQSLLKLMSIESVMPSNHLILRHTLVPSSIFPSIGVFSNESLLQIRWPKYWNFGFCIRPSNEYSKWISFRIDLFDLLAAQGTLKSLLQHHSSKASILQCSAFFMVQLSHSYMTTGKTIALTRQAFVGKVMSLLFNMLSRLVTAYSFFPKRQASFNFMQWFWRPRK